MDAVTLQSLRVSGANFSADGLGTEEAFALMAGLSFETLEGPNAKGKYKKHEVLLAAVIEAIEKKGACEFRCGHAELYGGLGEFPLGQKLLPCQGRPR